MGQRYQRVLAKMFQGDVTFTTVDPKGAPTESTSTHYADLSLVPSHLSFDLGIDARPNQDRLSLFKEMTRRNIPHIVVEKPSATSLRESRLMMEHHASLPSPPRVLVPFYFRFAREFSEATLSQLKAGPLQSFVMASGAIGIGCNGVHMLDLASHLFKGVPEHVYGHLALDAISSPRGEQFRDHGGVMHLHFPKGEFILQILPHSAAGSTMSLLFEHGKVVVMEQQDSPWFWFRQPEETWSLPYFRTHQESSVPPPFNFAPHIEEMMTAGLKALLSHDPIPELQDGHNALKMIALAIASSRERRVLDWKEDGAADDITFRFT